MKRETINNRNYNIGNIMTSLAVIAIIVGFCAIGIRLRNNDKPREVIGTEDDKDLTENLISREKALETINKSIGYADVIEDYAILNGKDNEVVKPMLAEANDRTYVVWQIDEKVNNDILIGFLFDEDSKVVWSESSSHNFWNPKTAKINLNYTDEAYQTDLNFNEGAFSYSKRNIATAILGPEQGENVTSVWAYDTKNDTLSLIWYNTIYVAKGQEY